jgi:NAD(P)H-hydrate epimerase
MASGGMGDVLTGMIAGFCAQGFSQENASLAGVYIHGMCADILLKDMGAFGFVASDIIQIIPKTIHHYLL